MEEAFSAADNVLKNAVAGISEIINIRGLINVDFQDVKTVMHEQGMAMMGSASSSGMDRAHSAAMPAVIRKNRASTIEALQQSGVDKYDIPAFLRKQADLAPPSPGWSRSGSR